MVDLGSPIQECKEHRVIVECVEFALGKDGPSTKSRTRIEGSNGLSGRDIHPNKWTIADGHEDIGIC